MKEKWFRHRFPEEGYGYTVNSSGGAWVTVIFILLALIGGCLPIIGWGTSVGSLLTSVAIVMALVAGYIQLIRRNLAD